MRIRRKGFEFWCIHYFGFYFEKAPNNIEEFTPPNPKLLLIARRMFRSFTCDERSESHGRLCFRRKKASSKGGGVHAALSLLMKHRKCA